MRGRSAGKTRNSPPRADRKKGSEGEREFNVRPEKEEIQEEDTAVNWGLSLFVPLGGEDGPNNKKEALLMNRL